MLPFFFSPHCLTFRIVIPGTHAYYRGSGMMPIQHQLHKESRMSHYKNVLVAIDGSDESVKIVSKGLDLIVGGDAKLSVALVFETLVGNDSSELNMGDFHKAPQEFQEQISSHTRELLKAKFPAIAAADVHFLRGKGRWGDQAFGGCSHDGSGRDR